MGKTDDTAPRARGFQRYLPLLAIAAGLVLFFLFGLDQYFSLESLRDNRDALHRTVAKAPWLALFAFVAIYAGAVSISFPGASILTVFGGFLFGLWPGVPAVVFAATLGAVIVFLASRTALGGALAQRLGGLVAKMEKGFREDELNYMFLLRLIPVFPFWAINIAAGVLGVRLRNFTIGTFFGIIPGSFVYASIGNAADAAFAAGEDISLKGVLLKPEILAPIIGLALLALLPILLKRISKRAARLVEDKNS